MKPHREPLVIVALLSVLAVLVGTLHRPPAFWWSAFLVAAFLNVVVWASLWFWRTRTRQ